jgi:carboxymethylenebutenolidase
MPQLDVTVTTPDGACAASLHRPEGEGPWPAVILYPDAGGLRPTFVDMGEHLASFGFVVLVPDVYHRSGGYEPFDLGTVFTDPDERRRLGELASQLTPERIASDAVAFADHLRSRVEAVDGPIGTTGYCMGGRTSLFVAGHLGERVGAAASFHGGRLAVEDDPGSPHLFASAVRATVYVGAARDDDSFDAAQQERLAAAYAAADVRVTIETYDGLHGFAVPDNPTYDAAAAARHWDATRQLFTTALGD